MSHAVLSVQTPEAEKLEITKASFEKHLGRKLTFSEKVAFKIFKWKSKKITRSKDRRRKTKSNDCATIVLKTGEILEVELIQVSPTEVKYKRCNKPKDPEFVIYKKDVFSIQNAAGEVLYASSDSNEKIEEDAKEKKERQAQAEQRNKEIYKKTRTIPKSAIISLVSGILGGLFYFIPLGLVFAILALIFGIMANTKIKNKPDIYRGKNMVSAGLTLAIIICAIFIIAALSTLSFI